MQDDRGDMMDSSTSTPDDQGDVMGRDVLGELIRAAGRRPTPPAEDYDRVLAASRDAWQRKIRSRRQRRWSYALAASVAILAIGVTALVQLDPLSPRPAIASTAVVDGSVMALTPGAQNWRSIDDPELQLIAGSRLRTQDEGRVSLDLVRGVSLRVNRGTELTLISAERIELTAGTIYVDSGLGVRTNRFEIATTFGIVRDIGTQFEVSSSPAELRLRVREGLVQLYQDGPRAELSGVAGEQVRIDSFGAIDRASFSTYDPEWAWASALADVPETDGQPLLGFLSWVARETGRALRFQPGAEAQAQITILHGSADNLAPLDALEVVLKTTDFRYELQDSGVLWIERRAP